MKMVVKGFAVVVATVLICSSINVNAGFFSRIGEKLGMKSTTVAKKTVQEASEQATKAAETAAQKTAAKTTQELAETGQQAVKSKVGFIKTASEKTAQKAAAAQEKVFQEIPKLASSKGILTGLKDLNKQRIVEMFPAQSKARAGLEKYFDSQFTSITKRSRDLEKRAQMLKQGVAADGKKLSSVGKWWEKRAIDKQRKVVDAELNRLKQEGTIIENSLSIKGTLPWQR